MSLQYRLQVETLEKDFTMNQENLGGPLFSLKDDCDYVNLQKSACIYMAENEQSIDKEAQRMIKSLQKDVLSNKKKAAEDHREQVQKMQDIQPELEIDKDDQNMIKRCNDNKSEPGSPLKSEIPSPDLPHSVVLKAYETNDYCEEAVNIQINFDKDNSNKKINDTQSNQSGTMRKFVKKGNTPRNNIKVPTNGRSSRSSSRRISDRIYSPFKYPLLKAGPSTMDNQSRIDTKSIFDTKSQISFSTNNRIEFDVELVKGKKEGIGKWFHKNGKQRYDGFFQNDGPHAQKCILYYSNGNF